MARWAITKGQAVDSRSYAGAVVVVNQQTPSVCPTTANANFRETRLGCPEKGNATANSAARAAAIRTGAGTPPERHRRDTWVEVAMTRAS